MRAILLLGSLLVSLPLYALDRLQAEQWLQEIRDPYALSVTDIQQRLQTMQASFDVLSEDQQKLFYRHWCYYQPIDDEAFEIGVQYASDLLLKALFRDDPASLADIYLCRSFYNSLLWEDDAMWQDLQQAQIWSEQSDDPLVRANVLASIGEEYSYQGESAQAYFYFQQADQFYQQSENQYGLVANLGSMATAARRIQDFRSAERYLSRQLDFYADNPFPLDEAMVALDYGFLELEREQYPQAETWFRRSIELVEQVLEERELGDDDRIDATAWFYLTEALAKQGKGEEAITALTTSESIYPFSDDEESVALLHQMEALIALARQQPKAAVKLAESAVRTLDQGENERTLLYALDTLVRSYKAAEMWPQAFKTLEYHQKIYKERQQQVRDATSQRLALEQERAIQQLDQQYEQQQAELQTQTERLKAKIKQWQFIGSLLASILVFGSIVLVSRAVMRHIDRRRAGDNDTLTGLASRQKLERLVGNRLVQTAPLSRRSALILIDIDQFSELNERHGHDFGNRVLHDVAVSLQALVSDNDLLARVSGDEFLALCANLTSEDAKLLASAMQKAILKLRYADIDPNLRIQLSIGLSYQLPNEQDWHTLNQRARQAISEVKADGGHSIKFGE